MSFNPQKMLQQMQRDMARVEEELTAARVEGSAGGGVVRAVVSGKRELVSVTIDPVGRRPGRRRDAPGPGRGRRHRGADERPASWSERRWGRVTGGLRLPGHVARRRPMPTPLIEPIARLVEAFARLPGIGPKTAQRLTYHLLRAPDAEARPLAAALVAVREEVVFCERLLQLQRRLRVPDLPRSRPRPPPPLRRRGAARRARHRADRRVEGALPRAPRRSSRPMDGIGPDRLRIRPSCSTASARREGEGEPVEEVILATNPTARGRRHGHVSGRAAGRSRRVDHPDRPRPAGRRRPRVRRRRDADPGPAGPAADGGGRREQPRRRDRSGS